MWLALLYSALSWETKTFSPLIAFLVLFLTHGEWSLSLPPAAAPISITSLPAYSSPSLPFPYHS